MTAIWMGLDTVRAAIAKPPHDTDGRSAARHGYADVAGPQSLCERAEARKLRRDRAEGTVSVSACLHFLNWRAATHFWQARVDPPIRVEA